LSLSSGAVEGSGAEARVPAVVLAGGKTTPEFAEFAGVPHRALADLEGRPMVGWVLRALRAAAGVNRIILVAPAGFPPQPDADLLVESDRGLAGNLREGLQACAGSEYALIVTGDIPFITAEAIDDYILRCRALNVDCAYAAVSRDSCQQQFPTLKRTCVHLPDGVLSGGNVVFQRVAAFEPMAALLEEAHRRRKNPLFLAGMVGPMNVVRLLCGRLPLAGIEKAASARLKVEARIVVTPFASLGTDLDKPDDLAEARRIMAAAAADRPQSL
jgi:CTP:molybdopterin cytidylyltransferase MocA